MDHAVTHRRAGAALTNIVGTWEPIEGGNFYAREDRFS